jgi:hypothetical protein
MTPATREWIGLMEAATRGAASADGPVRAQNATKAAQINFFRSMVILKMLRYNIMLQST